MIQLTVKEAQFFLVSYHRLDAYHYKGTNLKNNKEAVLSVIDHLGCLQYDPLNVVGRNPDLVLQSRIENYQAQLLDDLLYQDRKLIDGWDKMLSIYKTEDFPKFSLVRQAMGQEMARVLKYRKAEEALSLKNDVLTYLKDHGPCQSSKIDLGSGGSGTWGHRKLSSASLDYLFHLGEVGVVRKNNTQKVYDLMSRLLSDELQQAYDFKDFDTFIDWYVYRRINGVGLVWNKNGGAWLGQFINKKDCRKNSLNRLIEKGRIIECVIEGFKEPFYITQEGLKHYHTLGIKTNKSKQVRFIAPLDNLMWDRDMIEALFGFKYRWEVYTPVAKRVYGYYVLPVLYGHTFIGRIEFDQQRGSNPLIIKNWWWEEGIKPSKTMLKAIDKALIHFKNYCGAASILNKNCIHINL